MSSAKLFWLLNNAHCNLNYITLQPQCTVLSCAFRYLVTIRDGVIHKIYISIFGLQFSIHIESKHSATWGLSDSCKRPVTNNPIFLKESSQRL